MRIFRKLSFIFMLSNIMTLELISYSAEIISFNVIHTPPVQAIAHQPLKIQAIIYEPENVLHASIGYCISGENDFKIILMKRNGAIFEGTIPAGEVIYPGLKYFIFLIDRTGLPHLIFRDHKKAQYVQVFDSKQQDQKLNPVTQQSPVIPEDTIHTPSRYDLPPEEVLLPVTVLNDQEIHAMGVYFIPDILRFAPGIDARNIDSGLYELGARGMANRNNQIKVMVDGRNAEIKSLGVPWWSAMQTSLNDIKKIEIVNGPLSSLYGSGAYAGVIDIRTKKPYEMETFRTSLRAGNGNSLFMYAGSGIKTGNIGAKISTEYGQLNSWADPDKQFFSSIQVNPYFEYSPDSGKLFSLSTGYLKNRKPFFTNQGDFYSQFESSYGQATLSYRNLLIEGYLVKNNIMVTKPVDVVFSDTPELRTTVPPYSGSSDDFNLYSQKLLYAGLLNRIMVGGNISIDVYSPDDTPGHKITQRGIGVFISNEISPFENLKLTLSYRFDWNSLTPQTNSYVLGISFIPAKESSIGFSLRNGYRQPSFVEIRNAPVGLLNEEITAYQVNYSVVFFRRINLMIATFYNRLKNFIEFVPAENGYKNFPEDFDSFGGEADLRVILIKDLSFFLNYAHVRAIDKSKDPDITHINPDDSNPNHITNAGFIIQMYDKIEGSLSANYSTGFKERVFLPGTDISDGISVKSVKPYVNLNMKLGYSLLGGRMEVGLFGSNLLFRKHLEASQVIDGNSSTTYRAREIGTRLGGFISVRF